MDIIQFIKICDNSPEQRNISTSEFKEELVKFIDNLGSSNNIMYLSQELKKLSRGLVYLSIIDKEKDYTPYCCIVDKIRVYFNERLDTIVLDDRLWEKVIPFIKSQPEYPQINSFSNNFIYLRERIRAYAAMSLKEYGAIPKMRDCDLFIDNVETVYNRIDEIMTEIGGENALHLLLEELPYKKEIGRLLVPHQGYVPIETSFKLEKPYGYLFNLCMKYFNKNGTQDFNQNKWEELISLCTDLCVAVYDAQKIDIWEDITFNSEEVVKVMHQMVLRFSLYNLPQTNVSFTLNWCKFLCKRIIHDNRCNDNLRIKLKRIIYLIDWTNKKSENRRCKHIKKGSRDSIQLINNLKGLEDKTIVKTEDINEKYYHPNDFKAISNSKYPIIETDKDYILLPKPIALWNWFDAILKVIKSDNKKLVSEIGNIMESFIQNKMNTHGLVFHTGTYSYNNKEGEVDFLIEAKQGDVIIESKKKSLSLDAQSGDDYYIWGDLFSFIHSQMQCARLENGVKNYGPIMLNDKETRKAFEYKWKDTYIINPSEEKKRFVVKATMTLKEYGPIQDKNVLANIIKSLITQIDKDKYLEAYFDLTDSKYNDNDKKSIKDELDSINKTIIELANFYKNIGDKNPTLFCRFYSIEQIYFLIKIAKNQEHFVKCLIGNNVSTGTENFWNEYLNTKQYIIEN